MESKTKLDIMSHVQVNEKEMDQETKKVWGGISQKIREDHILETREWPVKCY